MDRTLKMLSDIAYNLATSHGTALQLAHALDTDVSNVTLVAALASCALALVRRIRRRSGSGRLPVQ